MSDELFLGSEALAEVVNNVATYTGFGVGLALVFWIIGFVIYWIVDTMRGV